MRSSGDAAVLLLAGESQVTDVTFLSDTKEAPAWPRARLPDRDERGPTIRRFLGMNRWRLTLRDLSSGAYQWTLTSAVSRVEIPREA